MDMKRVRELARRQLLIVLLAFVTCASLAYWTESRKPKVYVASASILQLSAGSSDGGTFSAAAGDIDRFSQIQAALIQSPPVRERVVKLLGHEPAGYYAYSGKPADILTVGARGASGQLVKETADAVVDAYIAYRTEAETSQLLATAKLLSQQTDDILAKLQETDQKIATLQSDAQTAAGPNRTAATTPEILLLLGQRPTLQSRYDSFFQRYQDTRLQIEMRGKTTERLSTANLPIHPVSPRPKQRLVLGAMAGLVLGLGAAALREQLDARLRNRKQLEEVMGLPVLAELPFDHGVKANRRLAPSDSSMREAARLLRTSIELIGLTEPVKRIMITSAQPGDGKTTVTAELAAAFARLGRRVVIVSADLRRSKLERQLGVASLRPGVSDFVNSVAELGLEGASQLEINDYIRPTIEQNLFIVPLGAPAHNPSELLASPGFALLLDALEEQFDVILVDTPPMLAVADASIVSQHVNAVLPVVSLLDIGRETLSRFKDALKSLPAQPLGLVMNKTSKSARYDYASAYRDLDRKSPDAPSGGFGGLPGVGRGLHQSDGLREPVAVRRSRIRSVVRRIILKPDRSARQAVLLPPPVRDPFGRQADSPEARPIRPRGIPLD